MGAEVVDEIASVVGDDLRLHFLHDFRAAKVQSARRFRSSCCHAWDYSVLAGRVQVESSILNGELAAESLAIIGWFGLRGSILFA